MSLPPWLAPGARETENNEKTASTAAPDRLGIDAQNAHRRPPFSAAPTGKGSGGCVLKARQFRKKKPNGKQHSKKKKSRPRVVGIRGRAAVIEPRCLSLIGSAFGPGLWRRRTEDACQQPLLLGPIPTQLGQRSSS
ncbi:hypothetical protein MAPG_07448 [Magnaporthiopsis poae ATCC 64411]|uniref:Uncharacterized protein n=1 Tax=Magnaporthiopsis poae (strain ATCC 64411 / 73-15) TaxID=644358 RepID=A0A0C4E4P9_MAGP6|nr:hypothetical protein MAPG_07448 [Magnaporthiopsis poae ATCC 64411]